MILELINVFAATAACWAFGAFWYGVLAEPWMEVAGVRKDAHGNPAGMSDPMLYVKSFLLILLVAGMMRHVFSMAGIDSLWIGLRSGFGIGFFFILPWMALNHMYGGRSMKLTLIDGGYAVVGCTIIGLILTLF